MKTTSVASPPKSKLKGRTRKSPSTHKNGLNGNKYNSLVKSIPARPYPENIENFMKSNIVGEPYVSYLHSIYPSSKLYKNLGIPEHLPYSLNNATKKKVIAFISLFKHGKEVFGTDDNFNKWLSHPNFHFDKKPPEEFIKSLKDIVFIDDRLTGMQYGDNA